MNKGNVLMSLHDFSAAIVLHDRAIAIRERLAKDEGRREFGGDLAKTLYNKGIALSNLGDHKGALQLFDPGIAIQEHLGRIRQNKGRRRESSTLAETIEVLFSCKYSTKLGCYVDSTINSLGGRRVFAFQFLIEVCHQRIGALVEFFHRFQQRVVRLITIA
jgi:hypothetical protein